MIIEFFGLPGSGKTTVAKLLVKQKNFTLVKVDSKRELFFYNCLFFIKHPFKFIKSFFYILRASVSCQDFYYKFMNCFIVHNAKYQKAKKFPRAIIDQGYFQNFLSVFNEVKTENFFIDYLKNFIRPNFLVVLELSLDKRQERLAQRGYGVRENFSQLQVEIWQKASEKNYFLAKNILNKVGVSFEVFGSEESPEQLAERIINKLENGAHQ